MIITGSDGGQFDFVTVYTSEMVKAAGNSF